MIACDSVLDVAPAAKDWIPGYQPAGLRIIIGWPPEEAARALMADPAHAPHLAAAARGRSATTI